MTHLEVEVKGERVSNTFVNDGSRREIAGSVSVLFIRKESHVVLRQSAHDREIELTLLAQTTKVIFGLYLPPSLLAASRIAWTS